MDNKNIFLALLLSLTAMPLFSQSYEEIYAVTNDEVRSKIDQNKVQGIEMLNSIYSIHSIGFVGVGFSQKKKLEHILMNHEGIVSCVFNDENTHVTIQSKPSFTRSTFESILQAFNATITGYSVQYLVKEQ